MNAKRCNRCGSLYSYYQDGNKNGFMFTRMTENGSVWTNDHKDLCPYCLYDLTWWLNGGAYDAETKIF